jgi:acyl-coenzyme A thioesterase PaaI-like protein
MFDSLRSRLYRIGFNCFPAYRQTGGRVTYIAPDWQEVRVKLPLNWRTKNYVGTTFGGSMYAAVDPFHMMMLLKNLGDEYVVWDKEAEIRFKKPGRETLYARCTITDAEVAAIEAELATEGTDAVDRHYTVDLVDAEGTVHATVRNTVFVTTDREKAA